MESSRKNQLNHSSAPSSSEAVDNAIPPFRDGLLYRFFTGSDCLEDLGYHIWRCETLPEQHTFTNTFMFSEIAILFIAYVLHCEVSNMDDLSTICCVSIGSLILSGGLALGVASAVNTIENRNRCKLDSAKM